jgi:hypothetical protein
MWLLLPLLACEPETDRLAPGPVGAPARSGNREVVALREAGARSTVLVIRDGDVEVRRIDDDGNPDRPSLSPDGDTLAWVSAASGLASVWVEHLPSGRRAQLTNVGLRPGRGRPEGWVAPPFDSPPTLAGRSVRWNTPQGPVSVALPEDWP